MNTIRQRHAGKLNLRRYPIFRQHKIYSLNFMTVLHNMRDNGSICNGRNIVKYKQFVSYRSFGFYRRCPGF